MRIFPTPCLVWRPRSLCSRKTFVMSDDVNREEETKVMGLYPTVKTEDRMIVA